VHHGYNNAVSNLDPLLAVILSSGQWSWKRVTLFFEPKTGRRTCTFWSEFEDLIILATGNDDSSPSVCHELLETLKVP